MKKYLYPLIVGIAVIGIFGFGPKQASAHGFVPHFLATSVTDVTSNSATLTGTVDSMHSSWNGHAWFEYGTNPTSGNYQTSWGNKVGVQGIPWIGQTKMSVKLSNLKPNTTYYFHLKAENKNGANTGETMSFTTKGAQTSSCNNTCNQNQNPCNNNCYTYDPNPCNSSCGGSTNQTQYQNQTNYNVNNQNWTYNTINNSYSDPYQNECCSQPVQQTPCCTQPPQQPCCTQTSSGNTYNQPTQQTSANISPFSDLAGYVRRSQR